MFYEHFLMLYKNEANTFWDTHKYLKKKKHSVLHINRLSVNIYKEDIDTSSRFCLEDVLLFLFKSKSMLTNFELENLKQWKKVLSWFRLGWKLCITSTTKGALEIKRLADIYYIILMKPKLLLMSSFIHYFANCPETMVLLTRFVFYSCCRFTDAVLSTNLII